MTMLPKSFSIKNWSQDDRPREKLRDKGSRVLSDAELLAILIGSGTVQESAVELSKRILSSVGHNLQNLGKLSIAQLLNFKGIGEAKAIKIKAAMELSRRRRESNPTQLDKINTSLSAFEIMQPLLGHLSHEEFWVLYLNRSNKIVAKTQLSKGGMTSTIVDVRIILKQALEHSATAILLAHNHPSGMLKPSVSDKQLTQKLKLASESLDIKVLDHIIVTEKSYFSFADESLL
ncbi:MAG: DNA repair protein RadC [Flavobacteriaceae bacterium]|jgi:DNA repair protein RadC|nr:DNA repair protein RadC [Flavobacteriaceae bacterium]MDG1384444.1 DNA repair protein RadC [Flavobacteriaceae bacterium]MDG2498532.1 DNA repair protein RadC [Flavobacteriaceae bacterium]